VLAINANPDFVIRDANFLNNQNGIFQLSHKNLIIKRTKFDNNNIAIKSFDSNFDFFDGNEIINSIVGLRLGGTYPNSSYSRIGDLGFEKNKFINNGTAIELNSSNSPFNNLIINNEINNCETGINIDGETAFIIKNNTINTNEIGVFAKTLEFIQIQSHVILLIPTTGALLIKGIIKTQSF
jgi:hypothetical protein